VAGNTPDRTATHEPSEAAHTFRSRGEPCAVWIKARINTEVPESRFFDWVKTIVEPNGYVLEAGLSFPPADRLSGAPQYD
jgi:hypothetical protein